MQTTLRRFTQLGLVPAIGLLALAASTGITHADGGSTPGHHLPIQTANLTTLTSLESGLQTGPGKTVTLDGSNFGTQPGQVCLTWSVVVVQNSFTKGGQLCLTIQDWQPTRIVAQVPADVVGVTLQTAEVAVYPSGGSRSNSLTIGFYPTLVTVQVDGSAAQGHPLTVSCSGAGSFYNTCGVGNGAAIGDHGSDPLDLWGDFSSDTFHLQLDNGWHLQAEQLTVESQDPSNTYAELNSDPNDGAISGEFVVNWALYGPGEYIKYALHVWVIGPVGVPLQGQ